MTSRNASRQHANMPLLVQLGHSLNGRPHRIAQVGDTAEDKPIDNGTRVTEVKQETTDDE